MQGVYAKYYQVRALARNAAFEPHMPTADLGSPLGVYLPGSAPSSRLVGTAGLECAL